jgi:hypothetical protein
MEDDDTELAASANVSDEAAAVARDAVAEDTAVAPQTPDDETTILANEKATQLADVLAWSEHTEAGPTEPAPYVDRRSAWRWVVVAVAVAVPLLAIAALGVVFFQARHVASTRTTSTPPPAAVLDGTYRRDYDDAKRTLNGAPTAPNPLPAHDTTWWAFRSTCTSNGCVATGTKLDDNDHQSAITPADTVVLQFIDGHWRETDQSQVPHQRCLGTDGNSVAAGKDTLLTVWSMKPQPDGTLQGAQTTTVLTKGLR